MRDPHRLKLEINNVDVTDLLRPTSDFFQAAYPDKTPILTVSAAQFQKIAEANQTAHSRRGDGLFDNQYFRGEMVKILSEADIKFLDQHGTARLVVTQL